MNVNESSGRTLSNCPYPLRGPGDPSHVVQAIEYLSIMSLQSVQHWLCKLEYARDRNNFNLVEFPIHRYPQRKQPRHQTIKLAPYTFADTCQFYFLHKFDAHDMILDEWIHLLTTVNSFVSSNELLVREKNTFFSQLF